MPTETYKYFIADTNLRTEYGGGAILNNGDTAEIDKETLCLRHICNQSTLPASFTERIAQIGVATGSITYIRIPDSFYSSISSFLTISELASVTSTLPTGFVLGNNFSKFQPLAKFKTLIIRGDSISDALGTTGNDKKAIYAAVAINSIANNTLISIDGGVDRELTSRDWKLINISLGGSTWNNTFDAGNGTNAYPLVENLAYNQRTRTFPLNGNASNIIFCYWLGTNDINYDSTQTGASVWARVVTRITAFKAQFPNVKIILCTLMKRSESSTLNNKINDFNILMRANYASIGVSAIADFEALVPQVNIVTGNTANRTYYTDDVHVTTLTHTLLAPVFKDALLSII
jgi:hypothetical protein